MGWVESELPEAKPRYAPTSFVCPKCEAEFSTSAGLGKHMASDCLKVIAVEDRDCPEPLQPEYILVVRPPAAKRPALLRRPACIVSTAFAEVIGHALRVNPDEPHSNTLPRSRVAALLFP